MRIVIDLQGAQGASKHRGIGRYSLQFALSVARNRNDHEVIIALNGMFPETIQAIRQAFEGVLPPSGIRVWHGIGPATGHFDSDRSRREMSKVLREAFIESLEPDIVHITSLFEGFGDDAVHSVPERRSYFVSSTFYDLIPLNNADIYLDQDQTYKNFYLNIIPDLMNVDLHLSISEYSRSELIESLQVAPERVNNVYAGADKMFQQTEAGPNADAIRSKFNISKPFLMYSGAADERKNHLRLIEAFSLSKFKDETQLVLAGGIAPDRLKVFVDHLNLLGLVDDVIITNTVSDDELVCLYSNCSLFVFPAWQEGFGLPLVEAMQCGAPVIGANTSCVPEIIDNPDALFDPFYVRSIQTAIDKALADPSFLDKMRVHGRKRASFFSWDRVGTAAIKHLEAAFSDRECKTATPKISAPPYPAAKPESYSGFRGLAVEAVKSCLSSQRGPENLATCVPWRSDMPRIEPSELSVISKAIALNHPVQKMKQLFVDVSELVHHDARTGIQRVVRSVLTELMHNGAIDYKGYRVEPVYATVDEPGYRYARAFCSRMYGGIYTPLPDDLVDIRTGDVFIGLDLQPHVVLSQAKTYQDWRNNGVEVYFVVYDLLPVWMPDKFPDGAERMHGQWLNAISKSDGLICISRSVADELSAWLDQHGVHRQRPPKIGWFHLGADVMQSMPTKGAIYVPHSLDQLEHAPTFLMVGTLEPRKGYAQTVSAFEKLWADGHDANLVIVGKQGWNVDDLVEAIKRSNEYGKRLVWLPSVSDDALETLYAEADCLIAASQGEGFGLPLVEAAQHGLPIFARSLPVFRELAGDAAFYFNGSSADSMAEALQVWLDRFARDDVPRSDDIPFLTWKQSTEQLFTTIFGNQWYRIWGDRKVSD